MIILYIFSALVLFFISIPALLYVMEKCLEAYFEWKYPKIPVVPKELTSLDYLDFLNRDASRVISTLSELEDRGSAAMIFGPTICLKQPRIGFVKSYKLALEKIRELAGGPRVKDLQWRFLPDESFPEDWANCKIYMNQGN